MSAAAMGLAVARRRLAELGVVATADQLYYATCRALLPPVPVRRPGFLLPRMVGRAAFERALADGQPPLPETLTVLAAASDAADLLDYELPRTLACQHDGIAAMLLANDLHMEASTVILGASQLVTGLPDLLRNSGTTVHVLHDATPAGGAWRDGIARRAGVPVRVLGLTDAHARGLHLVGAPGGGAELAAVPPELLLRTLRRLLAGRARPPAASLRRHAGAGFLTWPEGP